MFLTLLGVLVALIVVFVSYFKWTFQYWKKHNLEYLEPKIPLGNLSGVSSGNKSLGDTIKELYVEFKKQGLKHGGLYFATNPTYIPVDVEYVKNIIVKDFNYFTDKFIYYNEKDDPLSAHLFAIGGTKWKNLRAKLTPTFTTNKMKMMMEPILKSSAVLEKVVDKFSTDGKAIDVKEVISYFAIDVIGSCAFGLDCNSFEEDEESPFSKYGKQFFVTTTFQRIYQTFLFSFPNLSRKLGLPFLPRTLTNFFFGIVKDAVEYREKNNYRRQDFLQILVDLKNNKLDKEITEEHDGKTITIEEIAAQCLVFFIGGYETNSATMSFALLELSLNQDMQDKARKEINEVLKNHNNEITFNVLREFIYLEQIIDETLRKYPPAPFIARKCVKDYRIPGTDVTLEAGINCIISVSGIHFDEDYYPDPEVFDPERFNKENKPKIPSCAYLPFGEGPRICIGMRFALMEAKIGLAVLLRKFKFTLDPKTKLPIKYSNSSVIALPEGGIWLKTEKLY